MTSELLVHTPHADIPMVDLVDLLEPAANHPANFAHPAVPHDADLRADLVFKSNGGAVARRVAGLSGTGVELADPAVGDARGDHAAFLVNECRDGLDPLEPLISDTRPEEVERDQRRGQG